VTHAISLYAGIPFCRHRCSYCDFNTYAGLAELVEPYARALIREIELVGAAAPERLRVPTVFFGGGTPSLMPLPRLAEILAAMRRAFDLAPDCEITLEANPGTVDGAYLEGLIALGVNRISFGVQSAQPDELALLERIHTFDEAAEAVALARRAGFSARNGINVDLIFGLPYQTLAAWQDTLERALALEPEHISLYCLTLEPGTRLNDQVLRGQVARPDDDLAADMYDYTRARLRGAFTHYEVSNWARPGKHCRHNLVYWRNQAYLGLGAGAHGSLGGWRYSNVLRPRRYIHRLADGATEPPAFPFSPAVAQRERITPAEAMGETMMLGLRLLEEGVSFAGFAARHGADLRAVYPRELDEGLRRGLIEVLDDRVRLSDAGVLLGNKAFALFLRDTPEA
jgi:oxygen-independent coproporphyrinogen-3 oxidase